MSGFPKPSTGGTITSVDGQTGPVVDLSGEYLSLFNGGPSPKPTQTVNASATIVPDITAGNRVIINATGTGNPTINMPTVTGALYRAFLLVLQNDGTGGSGEPVWDGKMTFVGNRSNHSSAANAWDLYLCETDDAGATWKAYQLTALFSIGANYVTITQMSAASVPTPAAGSQQLFMDSADKVVKMKDENAQLLVAQLRVATTAPTNTNIPWLNTT